MNSQQNQYMRGQCHNPHPINNMNGAGDYNQFQNMDIPRPRQNSNPNPVSNNHLDPNQQQNDVNKDYSSFNSNMLSQNFS